MWDNLLTLNQVTNSIFIVSKVSSRFLSDTNEFEFSANDNKIFCLKY